MNSQSILFGIGGLIIGVLLTGFVMNSQTRSISQPETMMGREYNETESDFSMSMDEMMTGITGKTGDDFDRAFLSEMITHHQGAISMAKAAKQNAKHDAVKEMADNIISAQSTEILQMQQWQKEWNYTK